MWDLQFDLLDLSRHVELSNTDQMSLGSRHVEDLLRSGRTQMRRQYFRLFAYLCDKCRGPVASGSLAMRENEISRETDIREVGAICQRCLARGRLI